MKFSITLPVYNDDQYLELFLFSLPLDSRLEVIICSDGHSNTTKEIVRKSKFKDIIYLELPYRTGMYSAEAEALKNATGDLIMWANADMVFPQYDWISRLEKYFNQDKDLILFPNIIEPSQGSWLCHNLGRVSSEFQYKEFVDLSNRLSEYKVPIHANFGFPIFHQSYLNLVELDERFNPKGCGFIDFSYSLYKKSNIKFRQIFDVVLYHFWNGYQRNISVVDKNKMSGNACKFVEKHNISIEKAHQILLGR